MKIKYFILILFATLLLFNRQAYGINKFVINNDSVALHVEKNLDKYPPQIKFNLIFKLALYYSNSQPNEAINLLKNGIILLEEYNSLRYYPLQINYHLYLSKLYEDQNKIYLAANELLIALNLCKKSGNKELALSTHKQLAYILKRQSNYYEQNRQLKNAVKLSYELNHLNDIAILYNELATSYLKLSQVDSAKYTLNKALKLSKDTLNMAYTYLRHSHIACLEKDCKTAIKYVDTAMYLAENTENNKDLLNLCYRELSTIYAIKKDYKTAKKYLGLITDNPEHESLNSILSKVIIYNNNHDYNKAYEHFMLYSKLADSLIQNLTEQTNLKLSTEIQLQQSNFELSELKVKYLLQESDIKKNRFLVIISLTFLLFLIIATYFILNYQSEKNRNLQTIAKQKEELTLKIHKEDIRRIELKAAIAELQGQEMERERLAKDLHDSVGGTLAGLKMELESLFNDKQDQNAQYLIKSLHKCYMDVRNISKNISLPNFNSRSLKENIDDLIKNFPGLQNIKINFSAFPVDAWDEISLKIQKEIYRLIQEGITNVLKHANATEIDIQLVNDGQTINMLFEDDGDGFNVNESWTGIGIRNMQSRAKILKGELIIESEPGNGTTLNLTIPLEK